MGNDPLKWKTDLENFQKLVYKNIYDGIDLEYYFVDGQLKYDFIIAPGAEPAQIQMELLGVKDCFLKNKSEVTFRNDIGSVTDFIPESYQMMESKKDLIDVGFLLANSMLSFNVKSYDHRARF